MNNEVYSYNKKLKEQNWCKTCNQQKRIYKRTSKSCYMSQKIFDIDLVVICNIKLH